MAFNVRFKAPNGCIHGVAILHFLPRIGEEVSFSGVNFVVVNIIYDIKNGNYTGQDVDIIIKLK